MRIGLTGSMAAGKSTVSAILFKLGFYIVDADKTAHAALGSPEVVSELTEAFGTHIVNESGTIDRKALAKAAFCSAEKTEKLNSIIHPLVFEAMLQEAEEAEKAGHKHIVFDVPLLFETGFERHCSKILCVTANDEQRYLRIMRRDGLSRSDAAARLSLQMPQEEKAERSDAVIENCGSMAELEEAVIAALRVIGALDNAELDSYLPDSLDE